MTRLVYTPDEVAAILKCSPAHVRAMCARGEIPAFRLGGKLLRIRAEDLEALTRPQNTSSSASGADGPSALTKTAGASAADNLDRALRQMRLLSSLKSSPRSPSR
ncbi:helix-turn-helix domain-containing protein [Rhodoblastus sp.]|uniref:helix-turn-helix domain-containing protein n=1 Tax=Rhodoblastus sp. TaxID=1962975 RepID=UPI0035B2E9C6